MMWRRRFKRWRGSEVKGACQQPEAPFRTETPADLQRAIFVTVLRAHPEALTFDALAHRLFAPPINLTGSYAIACAVRELVLDGVLQSDGLHVTPTQATLCAAGLEVEL